VKLGMVGLVMQRVSLLMVSSSSLCIITLRIHHSGIAECKKFVSVQSSNPRYNI
jgi:hypothetical protein